MNCPNCGKENENGSLFCNQCGNKFLLEEKEEILEKEDVIEKNLNKSPKKIVSKKAVAVVIISLIIISALGIIGGITYKNGAILKFKSQIKNNNKSEAIKVFSNKIKGHPDKENKAKIILQDEATKNKELFKAEKISYEDAQKKVDIIKSIDNLSDKINISVIDITNIHNSREAFKKAEEFVKQGDIVSSIKEYNKVLKDDKNYSKAQDEIKKNTEQYRKEVLKKSQECEENQKYDEAIQILAEAIEIIPENSELIAKSEDYKKIKEEKLITELQSNQELSIIDCMVIPDYFEVNDEARVIVKNNTDKVVKKFTIGILMYDENGYPIKSGVLAGGSHLFNGKSDSANIQAGQTFGYDRAWNIYTDYGTVKQIIACVKTVEYYDGSKWSNDYYTYWEKEHLKNPLK